MPFRIPKDFEASAGLSDRDPFEDRVAEYREWLEMEIRLCDAYIAAARVVAPQGNETHGNETHAERVRSYMAEIGRPVTIAEIQRDTGISRGSIANVLYKTHPNEVAGSFRAGDRAKLWEWKPPPAEIQEVPANG